MAQDNSWDEPNPNPRLLTGKDIIEASEFLVVEPAALWAVADVETNGRGFLHSGKPKILFEGHIFFKLMEDRAGPTIAIKGATEHGEVCYPKWDRSKYKGGEAEYGRLEEARGINDSLALQSASWGLFQLMGFNFPLAGFPSIYQFVMAMYQSERQHLLAIARWMKNTGVYKLLQARRWTDFAKAYNGPSYKVNFYDSRLEVAYGRRRTSTD